MSQASVARQTDHIYSPPGKTESFHPRPRPRKSSRPVIQRTLACPCGGGCPECQRKQAQGIGIQAKLKIGAPNDKYEQEADRIADQVMSMPLAESSLGNSTTGVVQRKCSRCAENSEKEKEDELIQTKPLFSSITPLVQTKTSGNAGSTEASLDVTSGVSSLQGGRPMSRGERSFFEPRFGADFSGVRIHEGNRAGELARNVNARAFTLGNNIVMGASEYSPGSRVGQRLMAHELVHVGQQGAESQNDVVQRWQMGAAPVPAGTGWNVVTDPQHIRVLAQAEAIVRSVLTSNNCQNYFAANCTNGAGRNALQQAFNNARIYVRPVDDNIFGMQNGRSSSIAFNLRAFRIGRFMMASTLLHEIFHTCDPVFDAQDELDAENAVESCRLHTPWIDEVRPRRAAIGSHVRIRGWGFGPIRSAVDEVRIGGVVAPIVSWNFMNDASSRVEIIVEVPAGAAGGGLVVINNAVGSNVARFTVI